MRKLAYFLLWCILTAILMSSFTVLAETADKVDVIFDRIILIVNGEKVDKDTLLYNGITYVPLRATAEILGTEVSWDGDINTAYIDEKGTNRQEVIDSKSKTKLYTGGWQANNMVAAGYADSYLFNADNTFVFTSNQMSYHEMICSRGMWAVDNDKLTLTITDKLIIADFDKEDEGKLYDFFIYDTTELVHLDIPEIKTYSITKPVVDNDSPYSPTITINNEKFWNFNSNLYFMDFLTNAFK